MRASSFSPATRLALFNASSVATLAARRSFASNARLNANYGFVGLGQMGFPMAKNLRAKIKESDTLYIHDVNQEATKRFQNEVEGRSVVVAKSAREVAENSETVITVLPEPSHVKGVYKEMLQPATLLTDASITEERLFIDCSTIDPRTSAEVADAAHSSKQGKFVDAPMSGGVVGATAGKLTFMLGAPEDLVSRVEGILGHMGARVVHLGPQTSGLKGKLANNYLLALNNVATAEAMNMGVKWGLDATKLADMINTATGRCWPSEINNPVAGISPNAPASRDYKGGFGTALMLKDLKLALQAATEHEIVPLLGAYAAQIYTAVQADKNCENRDFSVVYRWLEQQKHQR